MAILNNTKKVTVEQLNTVAQAIATKSDARFAKKATTLNGYGITDAYTKTEVDTELGKKANSADLGTLASKSEVAKADLAAALKTEIEGKANSADVYAKTEVYTKTEADTLLDAKANTADLGTLASKSEVAETDLAAALATKINGKADKATTLNGYGITDAYTKTEVDTELGKKANSADLGALASKDEVAKADLAAALKTEIEGKANTADLGALASKDEVAETDLASALATKINGKADSATTLAGYGITDAYTKSETDAAINSKIAATYKPGGSIAPAGVVASVLVAANEGKVYDLSADLTLDATTAALFADGTVGEKIVKGTNIVVFNNGTAQAPSYKFDKLAGFVDLSDYAHLADVEVASAQDIQDIVDGIYAD